ncbi:hypothetical protein KOR42_10600 [Thalassoglobus neptunius]|uniref:GmrSD restriction endonucleases N-terminal domain-containing protein n=1 Tax=Thalassoglobus neptunius TaxID=1938619 RepID=A0A5C5X3Z6_9PLAN|nr:DUF262 domain-containing protein [Thalassoglobus neptunius]TWT57696.1 hypothetical protein KOR42_10600 [Thalassoglobus neptunius]
MTNKKHSTTGTSSVYDAVERERKRASVRSLDLSFNELADMHATKELEIAPEYQRAYRWDAATSSRFIESIVLEMPIPAIYILEIKEGQWELIDGLQRISSYLYLRGALNIETYENDREKPIVAGQDFLRLTGCDIVPELNGLLFDDLPTTVQYRVRRATLRVELIKRGNNSRFAYHMFKRLNTGGEVLSEQEVRNCSIRILGNDFNDFIIELSQNQHFLACTERLAQKSKQRMGRQELVLRFFAFKNNLSEYVHDISPFLTDFMERVTDRKAENNILFDFSEEAAIFKNTFEAINKSVGSHAFSRWVNGGFSGGFSMSHYEAFSIGIARVVGSDTTWLTPEKNTRLKNGIENAKKNPEMKDYTVGGGKNFKAIYDSKISLVEQSLREVDRDDI